MPCWVLPAVAAEMWGVSLAHVLAQIEAGTLASRVEDGSLLVDAGPVGDVSHVPSTPAVDRSVPVAEPVLLSDAELSALFHAPPEPSPPTSASSPFVRSTVFRSEPPSRPRNTRRVRGPSARRSPFSAPAEPEPEELPPDEVDDGKPMNWREVRSRVSRTRRPPPSRGSGYGGR